MSKVPGEQTTIGIFLPYDRLEGRETELVQKLHGPEHPSPSGQGDAQTLDAVNHPLHYGGDTIYEAIKVIEAWGLGFALGNAVKYIARAGRKGDPLEDLRKARWYLDREIGRLAAHPGQQGDNSPCP